MKLSIITILPLLLMTITFSAVESQPLTTMGKEFWFCFMDNSSRNYAGNRHSVIISSKNACSVTISMPATGWQTDVSVAPGEATVFTFPVSQSENQTSGEVLNKGYRLVASDTVSVCISAKGTLDYDVANVIPYESLRDEYMIQCYPSDYLGCLLAVVATEDSTWVDIHLTAPATTGDNAGDTVTVLLPRAGQVYQLKSAAIGDFSGTTIKSRDCKPIGVFQGDVCAYIPEYTVGGSCDHVFEMDVPTCFWGRQFVVMRSTMANDDRIRITSLEDGCQIVRDGTLCATIDKGETYEYNMTDSDEAEYVETSKPALVNDYFASSTSQTGDPSMVTIIPIEQMVGNVTIGSLNTETITTHMVNVVVRTEDNTLLRLDGDFVPPMSFTILQGNTQYSYTTLTVGVGSHTLKMEGGAGYVAYAFGMGLLESYAYSIGSSMRTMSHGLNLNGDAVYTGNEVTLCEGAGMNLKIGYDTVPDSVVWFMGDGGIVRGDSVEWTYAEAGVYVMESVLYYSTGNCFGNVDTIMLNVTVLANDTTVIDTVVCDSVVIDNVIYRSNTHTADTIQNVSGCDSIVIMEIEVNPSYDYYVEYMLEEGDTLQWKDGGYYWSEDQHPYMNYTSRYGCDSIERLRLNIMPRVMPVPQDSSSIWIPNVFTPEEGTNKIFRIECKDIVEAHVTLFTRQGLLVAEFDGLTGGWDGSYHGKRCKQGTYVYIVEYCSKAMPSVVQKRVGTVTLLK